MEQRLSVIRFCGEFEVSSKHLKERPFGRGGAGRAQNWISTLFPCFACRCILIPVGSSNSKTNNAWARIIAMVSPEQSQKAGIDAQATSLESLSQMLATLSDLEAGDDLEEIFCGHLNTSSADLLRHESAEQAGLFARRSTMHVLKGATARSLRLRDALSAFFVSAADLREQLLMTASLVLGGALLALQQLPEHALPANIVFALHFVQCWLSGQALEAVVSGLVRRSDMFSQEIAVATIGWLCGLQDRLAAACAKAFAVPAAKDFVAWLDSSYFRRLAEAQQLAICQDPDAVESLAKNPWCWELLARISLRGNSAELAFVFCRAALDSVDLAAVLGRSISKLADQNPSAGRALVCAILRAAGSFFHRSAANLVMQKPDCVARFAALLHPSLETSRPIQQLLAVQLWQTRHGIELSSPMLFVLVDVMSTAGPECWLFAYSHWLQTWAEPSFFQSSDLAAERNLGLRLARAVRIRLPNQDQRPEQLSSLLLRGIHLRLSAQTHERRLCAMAVAELLAEHWGFGDDSSRPQLRFDNFDRRMARTTCSGVHLRVASNSPQKIVHIYALFRHHLLNSKSLHCLHGIGRTQQILACI